MPRSDPTKETSQVWCPQRTYAVHRVTNLRLVMRMYVLLIALRCNCVRKEVELIKYLTTAKGSRQPGAWARTRFIFRSRSLVLSDLHVVTSSSQLAKISTRSAARQLATWVGNRDKRWSGKLVAEEMLDPLNTARWTPKAMDQQGWESSPCTDYTSRQGPLG